MKKLFIVLVAMMVLVSSVSVLPAIAEESEPEVVLSGAVALWALEAENASHAGMDQFLTDWYANFFLGKTQELPLDIPLLWNINYFLKDQKYTTEVIMIPSAPYKHLITKSN